jgi:hypothetical protein
MSRLDSYARVRSAQAWRRRPRSRRTRPSRLSSAWRGAMFVAPPYCLTNCPTNVPRSDVQERGPASLNLEHSLREHDHDDSIRPGAGGGAGVATTRHASARLVHDRIGAERDTGAVVVAPCVVVVHVAAAAPRRKSHHGQKRRGRRRLAGRVAAQGDRHGQHGVERVLHGVDGERQSCRTHEKVIVVSTFRTVNKRVVRDSIGTHHVRFVGGWAQNLENRPHP